MVTDTRTRFEAHLLAALEEAEDDETRYHIREGLQLAQFEGRHDGSPTDTGTSRRESEGRSDPTGDGSRRPLARVFASTPLRHVD